MNIHQALPGEHTVFYARFRYLKKTLTAVNGLIHRQNAAPDAAPSSHATRENTEPFTRPGTALPEELQTPGAKCAAVRPGGIA